MNISLLVLSTNHLPVDEKVSVINWAANQLFSLLFFHIFCWKYPSDLKQM